MNRSTLPLLACLLFLGWSPARGQEDITGVILDTAGAVPRASSARFTLHVDNYSTDEEAQALAAILIENGPQAALNALRKIEKGYIKIGNSLGYGLGLIRSVPNEKGRLVRAVTDRPIQMFEVFRGTRSADYEFGMLEIQLDADGKGEGQLIAAAKVTLRKDGTIDIESLGTRPFQLRNVVVRAPKAKKK